MKFKLAFGVAAMMAAFVATAPAARADALSDIKAAGKIRVATAMGVPLFAYVDPQLQPAGSDVETAKMIADSLGVKLELVQITNAARVPTIQAHKADILVANLAITPERKKAVDFTIPYATLDIIVAGPKGVAISDYKDLGDFVDQLAGDATIGIRAETLAAVKSAIGSFVTANHTTSDLARSQGVSIWLPESSWEFDSYRDRYKGLAWNGDTAWIDAALTSARPQAVGALLRYFRDLDIAEEAFQNACLRALKTWPGKASTFTTTGAPTFMRGASDSRTLATSHTVDRSPIV